MKPPRLTVDQVRRLALVRAGLLAPDRTGLPRRAAGSGRRARSAAHRIIERFGYLQLDTVSVAGARSHSLVLMSRLEGAGPELGESLLGPGEPLFEYWGHEASWMPVALYPHFAWKRRRIRNDAFYGDVLKQHPGQARKIKERIRNEGPLRSADLEGRGGSGGWWDHKLTKRLAVGLWSTGELSVLERRNFQRTFDLPERVLPPEVLARKVAHSEAMQDLMRLALSGHGWAEEGTLARTWRMRGMRDEVKRALTRLETAGEARRCDLDLPGGKRLRGWIRAEDLESVDRWMRLRPRSDRGVLLSPFDPLLWERRRVALLFGFEQVLEIFKPASQRRYGYFCLPVLAGENLVARVDLKARAERVRVLTRRYECSGTSRPRVAAGAKATESALQRHAAALGRDLV